MVQFPTPSIFHFSREGERQQASDGRVLTPQSKDKLPQVQSICFEHQSLPSTMSLMQSGYTWRKREGKKLKKKKKTCPSTELIHVGRLAAY